MKYWAKFGSVNGFALLTAGGGAVQPSTNAGDACRTVAEQGQLRLDRVRTRAVAVVGRSEVEGRAEALSVVNAALDPSNFCGATMEESWRVEFEPDRGSTLVRPGYDEYLAPWRLVVKRGDGQQYEAVLASPFEQTRERMWPHAWPGAATFDDGESLAPRLVAGDFDRDGQGEVVVFFERRMTAAAASDVAGHFWPNPFAIGRVYRLGVDGIVPHPLLGKLQVAAVRDESSGPVLLTYGGLFRMVKPYPLGPNESDFPGYGPTFRVFLGRDGKPTEDDPRQVEELVPQCAEARQTRCRDMNLDVAMRYSAVCSAPVLRRRIGASACSEFDDLADRAYSRSWRTELARALRWWKSREGSR